LSARNLHQNYGSGTRSPMHPSTNGVSPVMLWLFLLGTVAGCAAAAILAMRYFYGAAALTLARSIGKRLKDLERGGRDGADAPPAETPSVALLRELAEQARLAKPRGLGGDPWALVGSGLAALSVACFCALALAPGSSFLPAEGVGLSSPQDPDVARLQRYARARVDQPQPAAGPMSTPPQLPDVETMIGRLVARLQSQPENAEGWRMLGWSYFHLGQPLKAIEAYARAISLQPQSSELKGAYGEALVAADGGSVTPRAVEALQAALAIDAQNAKARYFLALGKAQAGNKQEALKEYLGLQGELQGDPQQQEAWVSQLREETERLARELKVDLPPPASLAAHQDALPDRPRPTPEAMASIQALPADQQQKMIREMVEGLAKRLRERPIDEEGWVRLIRSRVVLGEQQTAREDLARALAAFAGDASAGARIAAAAKELGVGNE
jgi:cytochrome c-type biogenesis protein CcmH